MNSIYLPATLLTLVGIMFFIFAIGRGMDLENKLESKMDSVTKTLLTVGGLFSLAGTSLFFLIWSLK